MKKKDKVQLRNIVVRYFILLIAGLFIAFSDYFYAMLLPLTIYPASFLLNLFYDSFVSSALIFASSFAIEIIPACVAVSAYFLLMILNLTTPMNAKKRVYSLIFSLACLLILNILRIFALSLLLINNAANFELIHVIFWYSLSIIFVIGIWFLSAWLFRIKKIPVYSDIKYILSLSH